MILERCLFGNLYQLALFTKPFTEQAAYVAISQVGQTLLQLHEQHVVHFDIKETNILLAFNKENQFKPECAKLPIEFKLADFGISKDLNEIGYYNNTCSNGKIKQITKSGTQKYMAPEQFRAKENVDPFKVEVFNLGVTLFHLIFHAFPFSPNSFEDS